MPSNTTSPVLLDRASKLIEEYDAAVARYEAEATASDILSPSDEAYDQYVETVWNLVPNMAEALRAQTAPDTSPSVSDTTRETTESRLHDSLDLIHSIAWPNDPEDRDYHDAIDSIALDAYTLLKTGSDSDKRSVLIVAETARSQATDFNAMDMPYHAARSNELAQRIQAEINSFNTPDETRHTDE